jgi:hypothetical protein
LCCGLHVCLSRQAPIYRLQISSFRQMTWRRTGEPSTPLWWWWTIHLPTISCYIRLNSKVTIWSFKVITIYLFAQQWWTTFVFCFQRRLLWIQSQLFEDNYSKRESDRVCDIMVLSESQRI